MKKKMVCKLSAYFCASLIIFTLITGSIFIVLYRRQTIRMHRDDMRRQAVKISSICSKYKDSLDNLGDRNAKELLRILDELTLSDVWIVDIDHRLYTHDGYYWEELPFEVQQAIDTVLGGKSYSCQVFSGLLKIPTLTVGEPIRDSHGAVNGAILLHAPVDGIDTAVRQGLEALLVSLLSALVFAFFLSVKLCHAFVKPLEKMMAAAQSLKNGDYTVRTGIVQSDEIGQLAQTIDSLAGRLDQVDRERERLEQTRKDFITSVSHELRTPVTVLRGSIEALRDGIVSEPVEVAQYHEQMLTESLHMERLVNDLLELSRLQNPDFQIEMRPLNLCDVISDVARSMRRIAQSKSVTISMELSTPECWFEGDYGRLRQMLMIVLDNAIKFSVGTQTINMRLAMDGESRASITILDHGRGISPEVLPLIFERFQRDKSEANRDGTGLGLAITKQIADRHGIAITVTSTPDVETEFIFHFVPVATSGGKWKERAPKIRSALFSN